MRTLEQVFGKLAPQTALPPFQLPDQSRTVLIYRKDGSFKGQATYWQRNNRWELIGCTPRSVNKWLYETPYFQVESALKDHGLNFKWVPSSPFLVRQPHAAIEQPLPRPEVTRDVH